MIKFFKSTAYELVMIVLGYIAYAILRLVAQMTLKLGRAVFSR